MLLACLNLSLAYFNMRPDDGVVKVYEREFGLFNVPMGTVIQCFIPGKSGDSAKGDFMKKYRRLVAILISVLLTVIWAAPSFANDTFKEIFQDALYGGLTGSLVGAAIMAFAKKPANHLDYLGYGAAGGVLVGTAFGLGRMAKSLAELDDKGKVKFAIPAIVPTLQTVNSKGQSDYIVSTQLLSGKF